MTAARRDRDEVHLLDAHGRDAYTGDLGDVTSFSR
jgi:hypothetical protein